MTGSIPGRPGAGVPELLAPAGSMEAFRAAVAAGADAVYLGGPRFGARQFADNFTLDEIRKAVTFAHRQGVKVYVTVNTLVHDREFTDVSGYLLELYTMGVDAILVQDIGLRPPCAHPVRPTWLFTHRHSARSPLMKGSDGRVTLGSHVLSWPGKLEPRTSKRSSRSRERIGRESRFFSMVRSVIPIRDSASYRRSSGAGAETGGCARSHAGNPTGS